MVRRNVVRIHETEVGWCDVCESKRSLWHVDLGGTSPTLCRKHLRELASVIEELEHD